jgi:hypothetical protein
MADIGARNLLLICIWAMTQPNSMFLLTTVQVWFYSERDPGSNLLDPEHSKSLSQVFPVASFRK